MNHSGVVPEIGYETYSQNSGSLYVSRIWRIFWSISIQCWAILNFPWFFFFDSLLWNDSFQSGKKHSRLEWILPDWNNIYWCGGEKPILVLQWNVDIPSSELVEESRPFPVGACAPPHGTTTPSGLVVSRPNISRVAKQTAEADMPC